MARLRYTIKDMQKIATSRGGKCLSDSYAGLKTKLEWQCADGHRWNSTPHSIIYTKSWCLACAGVKPLTLDEMQKIAKSRGGKCLSKEYFNNRTKLEWQCANGHRWFAAPKDVKKGTWCFYCSSTKLTIEEMQEIAKSRGGKCLSRDYLGIFTKLEWECAKKHRWQAQPNDIRKGGWCPYCSGRLSRTIEEFQLIAELEGGKCLSTEYVKDLIPLRFRCSEGHEWEAIGSNIKKGTWCPVCSNRKYSIREMQEIAESQNGKCLSKGVITRKTRVEFQCKEKHVFRALPRAIEFGMWCPKCFGDKLYTIEGMKEIAKMRGGDCLSKEYLGVTKKLKWTCEFSHTWTALPNPIRDGGWCPVCFEIARKKQI